MATDSRGHPLSLDLITLSSLTPPSPILSSTPFDTSVSWSELHIEFDFSIDEIVPNTSLPSIHSLDTPTGLGVFPSSSVSTVNTVGTFGPIRRRNNIKRDTQCSEERRVSQVSEADTGSPLLNGRYKSTLSDETNQFKPSPISAVPSGRLSPHSKSDTLQDKQLIKHPSHVCIPSISASPYLVANPNTYSRNSLCQPIFQPAIPIPASTLIHPSISCPPESCDHQIALLETDTPIDGLARTRAIANALETLESKCPSAPSSPSRSEQMARLWDVNYKSGLPKNLVWLDKAKIEFLIDQEGFRGVFACFRYHRYVNPAASGHQHGTAHYRPTNRQVFNFHYAPLDGPPVLRRLTVNGDESRDYISRQASLSLKTNGVYFVRGTEVLSFPVPYIDQGAKPEPFKHHWRFEYLVDDRRFEASGKRIIDGEKTLTPLSFSCSPLLLHPLQGKKVRLIQVLKKSLIGKLVAEKMEPPNVPRLCNTPVSSPKVQVPPPHSDITSNTKALGRNTHKRTATYFAQYDGPIFEGSTLVHSFANPSATTPRRRRASSAGECNRPESKLLLHSPHRHPGTFPPISQNIIPKSHLTTLINGEASHPGLPEGLVAFNTGAIQAEDPSFYPLSPSTRHSPLSNRR